MKPSLVAVIFGLFVLFVEACERHGTRCPDYAIEQAGQDYEVRHYPAMVWVSASAGGKSKSEVSRKLIKSLYAYLGGDNSKQQKLEMMVPVRTTKIVQEGKNIYTMALTLTPEQSVDPAQPTDPQLTLTREDPTTYAVRSFSGMARQDNIWDEQARLLKTSLSDAVNSSFYHICVYDSPWREKDRLNEVWLKAE